MQIKFTVVTVVYNGEKEIQKTMHSVLNQTVAPYEYLIIDGCSSDDTLRLAERQRDAFAEKGIVLRILSEKDTGIYNAMNKGIREAKGDFLSFLNCGDWYEQNALERVLSFYREEPFELTYGGLHYYKPDGTVRDKMSRLDHFPISSRHWNHPSMFLKREIYQKYGFDEQFRAYADFDLYLKLRRDGTKIRVIPSVLTSFVADGVSTDVSFRKVLSRAREKYTAYRHNGYSAVYWLESYGWEILKSVYFRLHS